MFDKISSMMGYYEDLKVARFEADGLIVDTIAVYDSTNPFETAISHKAYNDSDWVIVEEYATREAAMVGHQRWVDTMVAGPLPPMLKDVSASEAARLLSSFTSEAWREVSRNDEGQVDENRQS